MPPLSHPEEFSTPANRAACRRSIQQGSQSFHLASLLLPVAIREPAYAVYAFCRTADDLIDREEGGENAIRDLGQMLDRIYAGRPASNFVERGFADVVTRFAMPRALPEALIEGLAWDAQGRRYQSLDDLKAYAVRVAGTVGFMITLVMGRREPQVLARACDLGVAMQLTNIARDIGEDAGNGRVYMPLDWLNRDGVDVHKWLEAPEYSPPIRSIVEQLLGEAEVLYRRSHSGVAALPPTCRLGINAARLLYREIGQEVLRGVDPVKRRAITSRRQKLRLITSVIVARYQSSAGLAAPCIAQAQFLVEAVARAPQPRRQLPIPRWWDVKARSERMIELLNGFSVRNAGEVSRRGERFSLQPESYSGSDR